MQVLWSLSALVIGPWMVFWRRQPFHAFFISGGLEFPPKLFRYLEHKLSTIALLAFMQEVALIANAHLIVVEGLLCGSGVAANLHAG